MDTVLWLGDQIDLAILFGPLLKAVPAGTIEVVEWADVSLPKAAYLTEISLLLVCEMPDCENFVKIV